MNFLSDSEWIRINELVLKVNSIEKDPEFRKRILLDLRILIPYDAAAFFLSDTSKDIGSPGVWKASGNLVDPIGVDAPEHLMLDYLEHYHSEDPLAHKGLPARSAVYRERSLMSKDDKASEYFLQHLGGDDVLSCLFFHEGKQLGFLNLNRHKESDPFSDKDAAVLEVIEPHITNRLAKWRVKSSQTSAESVFCHTYRISEREADVVRCVMEGMSNAAIAERLCISLSTVKKHLESIFKKTEVKNRFELITLLQSRNRSR